MSDTPLQSVCVDCQHPREYHDASGCRIEQCGCGQFSRKARPKHCSECGLGKEGAADGREGYRMRDQTERTPERLLDWQVARYGDSPETRAALNYWRERGWAVDDPNSVQADIRIGAFMSGYREAAPGAAPPEYDEIEVCLGCCRPTAGRDCGCPAGTGMIRRPRVAWTCKAQKTADPPQDCDWPNCGCDPYAQKVLDALEEQAPGLFAIHRDNEELRAQIQRAAPPAPSGWPESKIREFIGFLSAEIEELHHVEVPRLAEAWDKFKALPAPPESSHG